MAERIPERTGRELGALPRDGATNAGRISLAMNTPPSTHSGSRRHNDAVHRPIILLSELCVTMFDAVVPRRSCSLPGYAPLQRAKSFCTDSA